LEKRASVLTVEEDEWVLGQLPSEQCKNRGTPQRKNTEEPGFSLIVIPSQIEGLRGRRV